MKIAQQLSIVLLRIYRVALSPLLTTICGGLGLGCRFSPTCSQYAMEAIQSHGFLKGVALAAGRLVRCHPWGGCGHDPVPPSALHLGFRHK